MSITVSAAEVEDVIAAGLIAQLDSELRTRYPGEEVNGIEPTEFQAAGGYFVIGRWDSQVVGCGAFRPYDEATVEIKRVFVDPRFRGRGIARAMLRAVESEARRRGYVRSILETAVRQPEAISLYRSCGYTDIEPFGHYIGSLRSVCLGKSLE